MSGPYIVKHSRPIVREPHDMDPRRERVLSQRAVADHDAMLREGDLVIQRAFPGDGTGRLPDALGDLRALGPEGGRVPLPDGSEIEVTATTGERLIADLRRAGTSGQLTAESCAVLCDWWNDRHGIDIQDERGSA